MGSSGSGRFTDYPGSGKGAADGGGGEATGDRCARALSCQLEDVEHCSYFAKHGKPPPAGTKLELAHAKRVVAKVGDEVVGNLPTRFNYLAACIKDGYSYVGAVTTSKSTPTIIVSADFAPNA